MNDDKYTFPLLGHERLRSHRESHKGEIYFVTFRKTPSSEPLDDSGCFEAMRAVLEKLESENLLHWFAFVLMPDHVHLSIRLGDQTLEKVMKRIKGSSAHAINASRGHMGRLWVPGYYDHYLRDHEPLSNSVHYIMMNPVRKGLVKNLADWPYSQARWHEVTDFQT